MRNIVIVLFLTFVSSFAYSSCADDMYWFRGTVASNGVNVNIRYLCDEGLSQNGCTRNYNDDCNYWSVKIKAKNNGVWGNWNTSSALNNYLPLYHNVEGTINWWWFEDAVKNSPFNDIRTAEELRVSVTYNVDAVVGSNSLEVEFVVKQVGNINNSQNVLCWNNSYELNEMLSSFGTGLTNRVYKIYSGVPAINGLVPVYQADIPNAGVFNPSFSLPDPMTLNPSYYIVFEGKRDGLLVRRKWNVNVYEMFDAQFISTAQSAGVITSQSSSTLMPDYVSSTGGVLEFQGSGLVANGSNVYFDPSIANYGDNVEFVRTNNNGCISDWTDTLFYVTPIVNSIVVPTIKLENTFGPGESGLFSFKNTNGTWMLDSRFHFGCSNNNYTFSLNSYQAGVTYEWKVMYQNYVYATGTGNTFSVNTPDRDNVLLNQSSSIYAPNDIIQNTNLLFNELLYYNNGNDIDGNGTLGSEDYLTTFYLGDGMRVYCRGVNVLNAVSDWGKVNIGIVPSVELKDSSTLCYTGNPTLSATTDTPVYLDSINYDSYRSVVWDVNNDGVFEYDGSVDNVVQVMVTNQKLDLMKAQIMDSVKLYGFNGTTSTWHEDFVFGGSEVCYSVVDTVNVVREPIVNLDFSLTGDVAISTPVLGVVSGSWFSVENDTIEWNWNDGSMPYFGDTLWHYLNDLGLYSLDVMVVDSFGCQVNSNFTNYWNVLGVLAIDEIEDQEFLIYPVPCEDHLTIKTQKEVFLVSIYDLESKEYLVSDSKELDVKELPAGIYLVKIETASGVVFRKISKL